MKIICDCGAEVYQIAVERLGMRPDGRALIKIVGVHVDVRPGPPGILFSVMCGVCGRTAIEVERSDPKPGDDLHTVLDTNVPGLSN